MNEEELVGKTAVFKALSDPNRLRIFAKLMHGDSCNCELKEQLGLASNLLSHHLKVLEKAGLVQSRRDVVDGRWIYYAINQERITEWHTWVTTFFDPDRIETGSICGPEGQVTASCSTENGR